MCVCCPCVYVCVCVRVSSQDTTCAHAHTCNHYDFVIFINFLTFLKSNSVIFQHALPVYFYLLHKQASSWPFLTMKLWEGVANAFRLFFSEF